MKCNLLNLLTRFASSWLSQIRLMIYHDISLFGVAQRARRSMLRPEHKIIFVTECLLLGIISR
jgi:hypothetical protein